MEEKLYPVFDVDAYFSSYGMHYYLIGAESLDDLKAHAEDIFIGSFTKKEIRCIKTEEYRIKQIDGLFTKEPYKIITTYAYFE